ncbi:hypothetical protein NDU88_002596 [Pleurodeles waltl]|uniref:Uncharacterized protein n=1 Tax=Pleurodeles waltl TaxID=8319 RepID=A0AAV7U9Q5_PLEWA|nr:hypothetical protein NDU88_002596 [Pleurodeles waltl]
MEGQSPRAGITLSTPTLWIPFPDCWGSIPFGPVFIIILLLRSIFRRVGHQNTVQLKDSPPPGLEFQSAGKEQSLTQLLTRSTDVVKCLCKEGMREVADPCELGVELCYLVFTDDLKQIEAWLASGISCNYANYDNRTPLHVAVRTNNTEMVMLLLQNGANTELKDRWNKRPIDVARSLGFQEIETLLERYGKNLRKESRAFDKQDPQSSQKGVLRSPQLVKEIQKGEFQESQKVFPKSPQTGMDVSKQDSKQSQKGNRKSSLGSKDPKKEEPQQTLKGILKSPQAGQVLSKQESEQPQINIRTISTRSKDLNKQESQQSQKEERLRSSPTRNESD